MKKTGVFALMILGFLITAPLVFTMNANNKVVEILPLSSNMNDLVNGFPNVPSEGKVYTSQYEELPFQIKALFDAAHGSYYNTRVDGFLEDIEERFGITVDKLESGYINESILSEYDILIIMNPGTSFTANETSAIKNFVENGGFALIAGEYYKYFDPDTLNNITGDYGVLWYDDEVTDPTDYDYSTSNPLVHVWTNTSLAKFISNDGTYEVKFRGTCLNVSETANTTDFKVYILAIGDNDTTTTYGSALGENITFFAAVDFLNGGMMILSGSSAMFRTDVTYYYYARDNREVALRMIDALIMKGLSIVNYEVPTETVLSGSVAYVNMTIKNNEAIDAEDVYVGVEIEGPGKLLNISNMYYVGTLAAGAEETFTWAIEATGTGTVRVVLKVWSSNLFGYQRAVTFNALGLTVTATISPDFIVLTDWNDAWLTVNVTNPPESGVTAQNVNVTVMPLSLIGTIGTYNDSFSYVISQLESNKSVILKWHIYAEDFLLGWDVYISITVTSDNMGYAETDVMLSVYTEKFVLFDQGHGQYYNAYRLSGFVDLLWLMSMGNLRINNGTFEANIVGNASLIIISDIGENLTDEEIALLKDYVEGGGYLWIMGSWYRYFESWEVEQYNNITGDYGIRWYDGEIMDDENNLGESYQPVLYTFGTSDIAKTITFGLESVYCPGSAFLEVSDPAVSIVLGNPTSYGVNETGDTILTGTDLVAIAAVELDSGGKILASGSSSMYADYTGGTYAFDENQVFVMKVYAWFFWTDNVAPTVEILSPVDGAWLSTRSFDVEWLTVEDYWLMYYEVYINGMFIDTVDALETSYAVSLPADGVYAINITAYDWAGLKGSDEITVYVDTTPASVEITSPANGSWIGSRTFVVNWTISDEMLEYGSVDKIELYVDGQKVDEWTTVVTGAEVSVTADGTYNITVVVYEKVGFVSKAEILVHVDATAPSVEITAPENGTEFELNGNVNVTVNWTASDNMMFDRVEIFLNDSKVATSVEAEGSYTILVDAEGVYYIKVVAYDAAGNSAYDEIMIIVKVKPAPPGVPTELVIGMVAVIAIIAIIAVYFFKFRPRGAS